MTTFSLAMKVLGTISMLAFLFGGIAMILYSVLWLEGDRRLLFGALGLAIALVGRVDLLQRKVEAIEKALLGFCNTIKGGKP